MNPQIKVKDQCATQKGIVTALLKKPPHSTAGVLPENIFSGCNIAGSCNRKPVTLSRKYSASLHGQEKREDKTLATPLENSTLVSSSQEKFRTIQRSEDENDGQPVGEQREKIRQVLVGTKKKWPGTQNKPKHARQD